MFTSIESWRLIYSLAGMAERRGANGNTFFVDTNRGSNGNDGKSWDSPFKTVAYGLAASHADIAETPNWANRNTVFICGDSFTEDLTALAQKTDVVGVGTCDGLTSARIVGNHSISATTSYTGCRFYNIDFQAADNYIFTIPTLQSGIGFFGCTFSAGAACHGGIDVTASVDFTVQGCNFRNWSADFTVAAINIGTGTGHRTRIIGNYISGCAAAGIVVNSSRVGKDSWISENFIQATGLVIDDNSDTFFIAFNQLISGGAVGATSHDINLAQAVGNWLTGSDKTVTLPFATIA